ncbi:NIF3-like protein 1 [Periplaneta americana]|uniref:NIF3-like protein 1 n=1 Tax=Periplaneta americana TaxID=6978 RepID=UPI0037E85B6C
MLLSPFLNTLSQKHLSVSFKLLANIWTKERKLEYTYPYAIRGICNLITKPFTYSTCKHSDKLRKFCTVSECPEMANTEISGLPLKDVVAKLDKFAPRSLAESWDNVGLLVEPISKKKVKLILLTNDLTEDVMAEAVEICADMIISYHPPIFAPLKSITGRSWKERIIATCLENKIAVYSPHTSFDAITGGVNDWLASAFEIKSSKPLTQSYANESKSKQYQVEISSPIVDPVRAGLVLQQIQIDVEKVTEDNVELLGDISAAGGNMKMTIPCSKSSIPRLSSIFHTHVRGTDNETFKILKYEDYPLPGVGLGRLCYLDKPLKVIHVVELVKKHIKLQHIRLALARHRNIDSSVSTIALCAGAGASVLRNVKADLYLTGEMSHHDVLDAVHKGTHVILCDHSNTERGFLKIFAKQLATELLGGNVEVVTSKVDRDPLKII